MQTTENLGLRKPEASDFYNIEDMNYNADVIDAKMKEIEDAAEGYLRTSDGTLTEKVNANENAMATFTDAQVRDILILPKTSEPTEGESAGSLAKGTIAFVRK